MIHLRWVYVTHSVWSWIQVVVSLSSEISKTKQLAALCNLLKSTVPEAEHWAVWSPEVPEQFCGSL